MQNIESILLNEDYKSAGWLFVYLHGGGGFGKERERLFKYREFPKLIRCGEITPSHPFVVLHALDGERWDVDAVEDRLLRLKKKFNRSKIHMVGYSRGGFGVYEYVSRYEGVQKATVINSRTFDALDTITPIEVFHATNDQLTPIHTVFEFVKLKAQSGISISLTEFNGDHHSVEEVVRSGRVV